MRTVMAAVLGAVLALGVALALVPLAHQGGATSPKPLLTSAPAHP
ncbi:SPW_0924 family protein [Streptacidiphilus cavernicola]|uniref:SPW_0924 family protein n=1 Tax=Streptacidiphilus cavernicola TaxID=3342716 RepID=A0ABV6VT66_9ACTN